MNTKPLTKSQTAALELLQRADGHDTVFVLNEPHVCKCCFLTIHRNTVRSLVAKGLVTTQNVWYATPTTTQPWKGEERTIVVLSDAS